MNGQHHILRLGAIAAIATAGLLLPVVAADAATLGYWRFENGADVGEATIGPDVSVTGGAVSSIAIPGTGGGSDYFNPVPQTSASNTQMANFGSSAGQLGVSIGASGLNATTFTVEALFTAGAGNSTYNNYLVSSWQTAGNDRSWAVGLARPSGAAPGSTSNNELFVLHDDDGSGTNVLGTGQIITRGEDYYVGIAFDQTTTTWTYYLKNLTTDSTLLSGTISGAAIHDPGTDGLFQIGRIGPETTTTNRWNGLIDEVRFSNAVLSESQLLVSVPEPASLALLGLGGMLMLPRRRGH